MASYFFLLHFPLVTFFVALAISSSNGENAKYTACSIPYSCGDIQNVTYPFWGENRPKFCGITNFKLNCDAKNNSLMYVFGDNFIGLRVLDINSSSHTISFSLKELFDRCLNLNVNNIHSLLNPEAKYKNISIFYGCDSQVSRFKSKSFNCTHYSDAVQGKNGSAYYFFKQSDRNKAYKLKFCRNNITFPVDKRGFEELTNSNKSSVMSSLTRWPIEANYTDMFTVCSNCEKSGGKCGSREGPSPYQFLCYCKDGSHHGICPASEKKSLRLILGLGISGGILLLLAIIGAFWCAKKLSSCSRRNSLDTTASDLQKGHIYLGVPVFSYSELVEATDNFDQSKVLGSGGFGIVYHGKLKDGREVAVKRLYEKTFKRVEQFMNEVELLTCLRHQNLVSLYGCTSHQCRELLLVYEFIKNGTVADHLHGEKAKSGSLPWSVRLRIAIQTASALSYLHASDVIHRDVKTNNILLDSTHSVKVVDFGLSRLFPNDVTHVSTAPQGTPGYLDPEYFQCYQLTDKSDVYSFGVVLIELISSLPAIDLNRCRNEINLSHYAINKIQRCAFDELVDPQLGFASDSKVRRMTTFVAELAFQCLQHDKELRPSMDYVLEDLKRIENTDYETVHVELATNDYESVQTEDMAKGSERDMAKPLTVKDDHALLNNNNNRLFSSSPVSVMAKWVSRSTTPCSCTSK